MIVPNHITTAEQLLQAGDIGRCELLRGELVMMSPAGSEHGDIVNNIAYFLTQHVRGHNLGKVKTGEPGFIVERNPDTVRAPEVAFVRADRLHLDPGPPFFPGHPDLAIEVVSPSDAATEVLSKVHMWLDAGCESVWVVDPKEQAISIYRRDGTHRVRRAGETLDDEPLLPGFALPIDEVFAD